MTTVSMRPQTNADCHRESARHLQRALSAIRAALEAQSGLEWAGRIEDLVRETEEVRDGCLRYAK